jgi:hypothetical protein
MKASLGMLVTGASLAAGNSCCIVYYRVGTSVYSYIPPAIRQTNPSFFSFTSDFKQRSSWRRCF